MPDRVAGCLIHFDEERRNHRLRHSAPAKNRSASAIMPFEMASQDLPWKSLGKLLLVRQLFFCFRRAAKLERARAHDLRHTFGQRLQKADVTEEDWAWLLGAGPDRHAAARHPRHDRTSSGGGQQGARDSRPNHAAAGGQRMRSEKVAQKEKQPRGLRL